MTQIFTDSDQNTAYDTDEIAALRDEINVHDAAFHKEQRRFHVRDRELCERYTELLLARRPNYPTDEHRAALDSITEWVHNDIPYGDLHGYQRPADQDAGRELPHSVHYSSEVQRINLHCRAPYKPGAGHKLWCFTDAEISVLRAELGDRGLRIIREWAHDDGHAFVVASTRV